jgi:hypothetical protein
MEERNEDNFTTYEEDMITLLSKLSETIETFNTLSRDQAENAILETNIKLSNCKEILEKMEKYIKDLNDEEETEKAEFNKKLMNYKTEYHEILNKYNEIQDNYINRKTENALMDENNESNLVDEEENKNRNTVNGAAAGAGDPYMVDGELNDDIKKNKENEKNEFNNKLKSQNEVNNKTANEITLISVVNDNSIIEPNNTNIMGYTLNPNKEKEEAFHEINRDYDLKKKRGVLICICLCIFIFFVILLITIISAK